MTQGLLWILSRVEEVYNWARVQPHLILLRKTQTQAQIKQCERELDNWDTLVEEMIDNLYPLSFFRDMDQRFPRGNCLAYTTMAKSKALATWDPRDDPSSTLSSSTWDPRALFARPESSLKATSAFGPHSILLKLMTQ